MGLNMFKVGDKVLHRESQAIGTVVQSTNEGTDSDVLVEYPKDTQFHYSTSSYTSDGKVWEHSETPIITPLTKLHKLLHGIED
jgi:hypothetical protein